MKLPTAIRALERDLKKSVSIKLSPHSYRCRRFHLFMPGKHVEFTVATSEVGLVSTVETLDCLAAGRNPPTGSKVFGQGSYYWTLEALCSDAIPMNPKWLATFVPDDVRAVVVERRGKEHP